MRSCPKGNLREQSEPHTPCYMTEPKARQGSDSDRRVRLGVNYEMIHQNLVLCIYYTFVQMKDITYFISIAIKSEYVKLTIVPTR